jgi:HAMP domain-containing protein
MMKNTIHRRLTLAFIALAIIPLLLVAIVLAWQSFNVQQQQALLLQREVAQGVGGQVRAFIQKIESQLRLTVQLEPLLRLDDEQQSTVLSQVLSYLDVAEELVLLDAAGQEQARLSWLGIVTEADLGSREKAQEFLIPLTSGNSYYSPVRFNQTTGEPFMTLAIPLIEVREGKIEGVLVADIRLKQIWELIASIPVESGDNLYMIDSQGRVVAHRNPSVVLRGTTFERPEQDGRARGLTGGLALLASDQILFGQQAFTIVVERSLRNAFAPLISTLLVISIVLLVAFLIASGLGMMTVRQIVAPIQSLAATAQAIEAGEERQAEVSSQDEIGILAQAFNAMAARQRQTIATLEQQVIEIKKAEEAIRQSEKRLEEALEMTRLRLTVNEAAIRSRGTK